MSNSFYVSCLTRKGHPFGFHVDSLPEAITIADKEVLTGHAVSAEVLDQDDNPCHHSLA